MKENLRDFKTLASEEVQKINEIVSKECFGVSLKNYIDVKYQIFTQSKPICSGKTCVKIYNYLKNIGINTEELE